MPQDGQPDRHIPSAPSPVHHGLPSPEAEAEAEPAVRDELAAAIAHHDDRRAIALIDASHGAALYRFIRTMVGRDDVADDLYQMTLVEAYRDLHAFGGRSSVRSWLFAIARHRCLDTLKMAKRRDARFTSVEQLPEPADPAPAVDQRLSDSQLVAALAHCLDELAPELRMVLVMRFTEGFAYDDIARICGVRADVVRARVCRAMPVLRRCIEQRGVV
jgi:RNA polymerase sigma-70 factor (ECF subfamily)